jgi:mRNA-degrading endonuclease RelE of RelBE toxin-antitoxin system
MNSLTTRRFRDLLAALPAHVRAQARDAYKLFRENPSHPGLHFKKVHPDPPTYSARVGIGYRAVCVIDGETVTWFWIGSHADYDKLLKQL